MTEQTTSKAMCEIHEAVQVAEAIRHARTAGDIWRALKAFVEPLGFVQLTVLSALDASADKLKPHIVYSDAPAAFNDAFDEHALLQHHPLIQHALTTNEPFTVRQIQALGLTPEQRRALEWARSSVRSCTFWVIRRSCARSRFATRRKSGRAAS